MLFPSSFYACTSFTSSQNVPLPRKPTGQGPHSQEPSGELVHSAPPKHGLDRQPSEEEENAEDYSLLMKLKCIS